MIRGRGCVREERRAGVHGSLQRTHTTACWRGVGGVLRPYFCCLTRCFQRSWLDNSLYIGDLTHKCSEGIPVGGGGGGGQGGGREGGGKPTGTMASGGGPSGGDSSKLDLDEYKDMTNLGPFINDENRRLEEEVRATPPPPPPPLPPRCIRWCLVVWLGFYVDVLWT